MSIQPLPSEESGDIAQPTVSEEEGKSVRPLTSEEAGNLEKNYDRLMQMAAELDRALYAVNVEMQEAYKSFLKIKTELDMLKSEKTTIIERSRLVSRMLSKF